MVKESPFGWRWECWTKYCFKKRNFWNSFKFEHKKLIISASLRIAEDNIKKQTKSNKIAERSMPKDIFEMDSQ